MKKVSIVIPVYNVERYLCECIDSVVVQTYKNIEIIFIDDGSTDSSGKILDEYASTDNRIKVLHQQNSGAAVAKNVGIDLATGYYLTFMDSDDIVESNWISTMVELLEVNNADLVECAFDKLYVDHYEEVDSCKKKSGTFDTETYMEQYLNKWTNSLFWNKLFKKGLTNNIRFRNERRCIDDEFYTYKIVTFSKKIVRTDKVLYHYRQRTSSAVQSKEHSLQITEDAMDLRIERYEWIKKFFPNLRKVFIKKDIEFLIYFASNSVYDTENIKKYRKVSKYYLVESIKLGIDFRLCFLALQFCFTKPQNNVDILTSNNSKNTQNLFE